MPELIDILGVEVPVPPDVSLTAIGSDKATITWSHPPPNRPVEKYVIQVNGVNGAWQYLRFEQLRERKMGTLYVLAPLGTNLD